ncbi:MAG: DUF2062 domain-containing protein [archaeon]
MVKKLITKIKKHFKEVLELKTTTHEIALGFAIGTAIALLPTLVLDPLIIALVILVYKKISKISLLLAFIVWNPLLLTVLIPLYLAIGDFILGDFPVTFFKIEILNEIFRFTFRYLIGNLIVTAILTIISYYVVYFLVKKYKKKELPIIQDILDM